MATLFDQSEPSTSCETDTECGSSPKKLIDQSDYDRCKEGFWSKVVCAEKKFQELKPILHKIRLEQLETVQKDILARRSDVYLKRHAVLVEDISLRRKNFEIYRRLRLDAARRKYTAERRNASLNLRETISFVRNRLLEEIKTKREKLSDERLELRDLIQTFDSTNTKLNNSQFRQRFINKKNGLFCDVPVMIVNLPKDVIENDLHLFDDSKNIA